MKGLRGNMKSTNLMTHTTRVVDLVKTCYGFWDVLYHAEFLCLGWAGMLKLVHDLIFICFFKDLRRENETKIVLFEVSFDINVENVEDVFRSRETDLQ
jgi:hypothetical protein